MSIEINGDDETITVDGLVISLALLKIMCKPDPAVVYSMKRKGNVVIITSHRCAPASAFEAFWSRSFN